MVKPLIAAVLWALVAIAIGSFLERELAQSNNGNGDQVPAPTKSAPAARMQAERPHPPVVASDHSGGPTQPPSHPAQVSMKAADWNIRDRANWLAAHPSQLSPADGWQIKLPMMRFLITTASPVLIQGWYVKMSGRASGMDCWMYFSESLSDDLSGQYYRWLSTKPLIPSANGNFVQFVSLEPEFWSTATGERGDASPAATAGFQQALANPQSIGIICRGDPPADDWGFDDWGICRGCPFDGDRFANAATFTMDSFAVCDPFADAPSAKQENAACAPPRVP